MKPDYDQTVARIAGNIAAGMVSQEKQPSGSVLARRAVSIARLIIDEVRRTEPKKDDAWFTRCSRCESCGPVVPGVICGCGGTFQ